MLLHFDFPILKELQSVPLQFRDQSKLGSRLNEKVHEFCPLYLLTYLLQSPCNV
uniref:Uncharacterized protein n=1 Tax=Manihot esculenta TaxID=3983 RepID=A0A2C9W447_MANES